MIVKEKISELEEEVRVGCSRIMRKELTGVVQIISGRKRFLARFQDGCKMDLTSNQLTIRDSREDSSGGGTQGDHK